MLPGALIAPRPWCRSAMLLPKLLLGVVAVRVARRPGPGTSLPPLTTLRLLDEVAALLFSTSTSGTTVTLAGIPGTLHHLLVLQSKRVMD